MTPPLEQSVSVRLHHLKAAAVLAVSIFSAQFADTEQPAAFDQYVHSEFVIEQKPSSDKPGSAIGLTLSCYHDCL